MNAKHIQHNITTIKGFKGPYEGELLVQLRVNGEEVELLPVDEAIEWVKDHPRLEIEAVEKWKLY